jgi:sulfonate transport system substrate-binding protein
MQMDGSDVSAGRRRVLRLLSAAPAAAALNGFASQEARAADAALGSVTLVLGDQAGGTRALAEAAKVLDGTPYAFKWANFQGAARSLKPSARAPSTWRLPAICRCWPPPLATRRSR